MGVRCSRHPLLLTLSPYFLCEFPALPPLPHPLLLDSPRRDWLSRNSAPQGSWVFLLKQKLHKLLCIITASQCMHVDQL